MFLIYLSNLNLLSVNVPESLMLLIFGISLTGGTIALRRFLKRHENPDGENIKREN